MSFRIDFRAQMAFTSRRLAMGIGLKTDISLVAGQLASFYREDRPSLLLSSDLRKNVLPHLRDAGMMEGRDE